MTIIATASVPSHLTLLEADTVEIRTRPRTLTEQVRQLAGRGLSRDETNEQLRTIAATRPPMTDAQRTEHDAWVMAAATTPAAELAATYGIGLDTAERLRVLFAGSGASTVRCPDWCEMQGKHLVDEHPEDLTHFGDTTQVECTFEHLVGQEPHRAWAGLVQHTHDRQPRINAFLGHDPIDMTPAEAREYAALLLELADAAEQTGADR